MNVVANLAQRTVVAPVIVLLVTETAGSLLQAARRVGDQIMHQRFGQAGLGIYQWLAKVHGEDAVEPALGQQAVEKELAAVADAAVVDFHQHRSFGGENEFAVAHAEIDAESSDLSQCSRPMLSAQ